MLHILPLTRLGEEKSLQCQRRKTRRGVGYLRTPKHEYRSFGSEYSPIGEVNYGG